MSKENEIQYGGKTIEELAGMPEDESATFLRDLLQNKQVGFTDYALLSARVAGVRVEKGCGSDTGGETGLGVGVIGVAGIAEAALELLRGKSIEYDGYISENRLFESLKNKLSTSGFLVSERQAEDPKQTVFDIRNENPEEPSILQILLSQKKITNTEIDLQKAFDLRGSEESQNRMVSSIQISPVDINIIKNKGAELLKNAVVSDENIVPDTGSTLTEMLGAAKKFFSLATLTLTVSEVVGENGKAAESERKLEVSNIGSLNKIYIGKLFGDVKCTSCNTSRLEELSNCEGCGAPLEPQHYQDFKERLAAAGVKI